VYTSVVNIFENIGTFETAWNKDFCDWNIKDVSTWLSTKKIVKPSYLMNLRSPLRAYVTWCEAHGLRKVTMPHPMETDELNIFISESKVGYSTFYGFEELDDYMSKADDLDDAARYYASEAVFVLIWLGFSTEMMRFLRTSDIDTIHCEINLTHVPKAVELYGHERMPITKRQMFYLQRYMNEGARRCEIKEADIEWFIQPTYSKMLSETEEQIKSPLDPVRFITRWTQLIPKQPLTSPLRDKKIYRSMLAENNLFMLIFQDQAEKQVMPDDSTYWAALGRGEYPKEWGLLADRVNLNSKSIAQRIKPAYLTQFTYFEERA
jgi:hypothetical protein